MAKYQVLKRTPHQIKDADNQLVSGEMVEFVQIPDEGPAQVQVYFVPENKSDEEILGVATKHHEDELSVRGIGFSGPQGPLDGVKTEVEPIMEVSVSQAGKVSVKEVKEVVEETAE
jgi:hypothetical protein